MKLLTKQIASVIFNMNTSSDLMKWDFFLFFSFLVYWHDPYFDT